MSDHRVYRANFTPPPGFSPSSKALQLSRRAKTDPKVPKCALSRDFLSSFFPRRALGRDRTRPGPPSFVLSLSLSFVSYSTECERKIERRREKDFNKNFASSARRNRREKRERERARTPREKSSRSLPPTRGRGG